MWLAVALCHSARESRSRCQVRRACIRQDSKGSNSNWGGSVKALSKMDSATMARGAASQPSPKASAGTKQEDNGAAARPSSLPSLTCDCLFVSLLAL